MDDQERLDAIDVAKEVATNLTAGLEADGKPSKPPKSPAGERKE